jgi:hypothetical protein
VLSRIWQYGDDLYAPIVTSLISRNSTVLVVKVEMASSLSDSGLSAFLDARTGAEIRELVRRFVNRVHDLGTCAPRS